MMNSSSSWAGGVDRSVCNESSSGTLRYAPYESSPPARPNRVERGRVSPPSFAPSSSGIPVARVIGTVTPMAPDRSPLDPTDFLGVDALLSDEERMIRDATREWVRDRVLPGIDEWFQKGEFPREVAAELGKLGLLGMHLQGYGCAGTNAVSYGLASMELEAGDSGFRSFVSVQGSLPMFPIWKYGSEEQKQAWLPRMTAGGVVGCFGLTEPDAGSDPGRMRTKAERRGGDWLINGTKMWITNGGIADVAVVWARTDDGIRGFIVPTDTPGLSTRDVERKLSLRASV